MKKLLLNVLTLLMVLLLVACSGTADTTGGESTEESPLKIGLITSAAGLGDKSLNDGAYAGLLKAQDDFGIVLDYVEPTELTDYEMQIRQFAETEEYDLLVGLGNNMLDAMVAVSEDYPEQKFAIVDSTSEYENIRGIYVKQQEQLFLAGIVAGLVTQDERMPLADTSKNVVGTFIGAELPNLLDAVAGYEAGVRFVNPEAEVLVKVAGNWVDPALGKTLALELNNSGADVVVQMAGGTGLGLFTAIEEAGFYGMGMGVNQNDGAPDQALLTAIKRIDVITYNEVKDLIDGNWSGGTKMSGIAEEIVGIETEGSNVEIPQDILDIANEVKDMVVDGSISIPDRNEDIEAWVADNNYYSK